MISLLVYERLAQSSTAFIQNLTSHIGNSWSRSIRALGGYWLGDFRLTSETMPTYALESFYNTAMGRRVVETTFGFVTWEGEIVEMELELEGIVYRRSMRTEQWHNKLMVTYTDNATKVAASTGWATNSDSINQYGESCYIDVVDDAYDLTSAEAARDRRLAAKAYPRSISVSVSELRGAGTGQPSASLSVHCAGYVFGMNRRYQTADIAATDASAQISSLVGNSEFVTVGDVDTNTLSVPVVGTGISQRIWNLAESIVLMGDGTNRWVGGVYSGRKFDYKAAETAVTHYWHGGGLRTFAGYPVMPSMVRADIIVRSDSFIGGAQPASGSVWDNPENIYIEEVEFTAPDRLRLVPYREGF